MKFSTSLLTAALAATVAAIPVGVDITDITGAVLESRATGTTANDFVNGGCKDVILFYARGTTQPGNMGDQPGPQTADGLISALGSSRVAIQGVSYGAGLLSNLLPGGCDANEAKSFAAQLTSAASACPSSALVVSGYSQGAALVHAAVELLSASARARIAAAVTYGDTQKKQDGGKIPGLDASKSLILCNNGDLVCEGSLVITSAHLSYTSSVATAVSFIRGKI